MNKKMNPLKGLLAQGLLASLLVSGSAMASFENFTYKDFRANGIYATSTTGNSYSGELSFHPNYALNSSWDLRGIIGFAPLKGEDETFIMSEYGVMAAYNINPEWEVEAGAGLQSWSGQSSSPMVSANVLKSLKEPFMGYVNQLFAGYSMVSHDEPASEFKIGVTFSFGKVAQSSNGGM
jgi:hypothetical protein